MLDQAICRISDPAPVRALVSEHSWVTFVSDLHTTGFRLLASRVAAETELSQDTSAADRTGLVEGPETDQVHANRSLADRMRADGVLP